MFYYLLLAYMERLGLRRCTFQPASALIDPPFPYSTFVHQLLAKTERPSVATSHVGPNILLLVVSRE